MRFSLEWQTRKFSLPSLIGIILVIWALLGDRWNPLENMSAWLARSHRWVRCSASACSMCGRRCGPRRASGSQNSSMRQSKAMRCLSNNLDLVSMLTVYNQLSYDKIVRRKFLADANLENLSFLIIFSNLKSNHAKTYIKSIMLLWFYV